MVIIIGFVVALAFMVLENHRDSKQIKILNQKVKELIAGDYSDILDMRGSPEITDMTNSLNDLSEVIRLTHDNLEQEKTRLSSILSYMSDGVIATDRMGRIIMVNDMAQKQLVFQPNPLRKRISWTCWTFVTSIVFVSSWPRHLRWSSTMRIPMGNIPI